MNVKDMGMYSDAEKIILAEELWDSVSKKDVALSDTIKKELDTRLKNLEEGKSRLYSWSEVRAHRKTLR